MDTSVRRMKSYRLICILIFLGSILLMLALPDLDPGDGPLVSAPPDFQLGLEDQGPFPWLSIVSVATSVISLLGVILTTWAAWRKERRESRDADLEYEKKKLELELMREDFNKKANGSKSSKH